MKMIARIRIFAVAALVLTGSVAFAADETGDAGTESPGVVVKVKKAIEHGAKATAHGIKRGADATARGIKRGATATSNAAHKVVKKLKGSSDSSEKPSSSDE